MRLDDRLTQLSLTVEQHFFAVCWYNMVHAFSLDSYRVRAMNPGNGLRELQRMMAPHANTNDLSIVATELQELLQADPVLKHPPFAETTTELLDLLIEANKEKDKSKGFDPRKPLILAFSNELSRTINTEYIGATLAFLEEILITNVTALPQDQKNAFIHTLTGNLLSTLLDQGASVESLFQLYRQVIRGSKPESRYVFSKKFGLLVKLITQKPSKFSVVFAVDNVSNAEAFPNRIGSVNFLIQPPSAINPKPPVERYLTAHQKRLFAQVEVQTNDHRTAGTNAYATINNLLDLVRFEYEPERLQLHHEFIIASDDKPNSYRIFPIPKVVPNPSSSIDTDDLQAFIESVNELMDNPGFEEDGRSRVQSAFRLYRIGADTYIFENKLTNWWTAIEYLVKSGNTSTGIGAAVESGLVPVLCLGYIPKLLLSFRNALVDIKAQLTDQSTGQAIQLRDLTLSELYQIFKNPAQCQQLLDAATDPFLKQKLTDFLNALSEPKKTEAMLKIHERRLRWQVQRLYRARCDIVHSAERIVNAALLCANLEFYLKTTLTALLRVLRETPHISGPKEFFDRQNHAYSKLCADLKAGQDMRLLSLLEK